MDKKESVLAWTQLIALLLAAIATGAIGGICLEKWQQTAHREPIEVGDFSQQISLLHFDAIENGMIRGRLEGSEARVVVSGAEEVYSLFPGDFAIPVIEILPLLQKIPAPEGMLFVASDRGKYFYPIDSPRAALITVKNRIFFPNRTAARKAGFADGKR